MANKTQTVVIRGKLMYAKVLGEPIPNFAKDGKEWKTDIVVPKSVKKEMTSYGIADRIKMKDNYADGEPYMSFKQAEFKASGEPNKHIEIVDILGKPWPKDKLIGNGSVADLKFAVVDYGPGKKPGAYIRSLRILDHVPYDGGNSFGAVSEDDEYFKKAALAMAAEDDFKKDFGLEETASTHTGEVDDDLDDL